MNIPNIENVDMGDAPRHADLDVPSPEDQSSGSEATQTSQDLVGPAHPDQPQPDVGIQTMQSEEAPRHKEQEDEYYETFPHGIATLEHSTRSPDDVSSEMEPEEAASFELGQDYIDEDGVESSEAEHDDGRGDESQSENEAVSETAELPRHPPAQTEVICLDSDSEDELASNALAASRDPGMNLHHQDQNEDEYLESEEESEPAESEDDNAETFADDLHDSDKDDESSVDVLARDHYAESFWSQSSPAEQSANQEMDSEDEKSEPDNHGNVNINESASNSHAIIVLDSDEESQEQSADDMPRRGESRQSLHYDGAADVCEEEFADEDSVHEELVDEFVSEDAVDTEHQGKPGTHLEDADNEQDLPMDSSEPRQQLPIPGPTQDLENAFDSRIRKPDEGSNTSEQENSEEPPLNLASDQPEAPDDTDELASEKHDVGLLDDLEDQKMHEETGAEDNSNVDAAIVDLVPTINAPMRLLVDSTETSNVQPLKMPEVVISPLPVPDRNAHGLRSKVSYYAPLASLVDHYNALVDTISIVREVSPIAQATSSPKDYYSTLQLTDRSMAGTILQAQIFRRHPGAIPALAEGDAVLLRDFKVRSYDHSIMLVSVETSSWAVFNGSGHDPQIEGPPVEYGTEECAYAADLRKWYLESGAAMIADYELQSSIHEDSLDYLKRHASPGSPATPGSVVFSDSGSIESISHESQQEGQKRSPRDSRRRRSNRNHRRITIHELRHGRRYTEVGSPSAKESIHELRDGTLYANL
ncbi:hypothetical protein N7470_006021 [Penicillium chermesinum]|nr:hypothetical protein N7470_006021 [Penicillium chermesinum]